MSQFALVALAGWVLLLASCGSDDDPASPSPSSPPEPAVAELPPLPLFACLDPGGRAFEDTVTTWLTAADTPEILRDALAAAPALAWAADGECRTGHDAAAGFDLRACQGAAGWNWEVVVSPSVLLADGQTDGTGRTGAFRSYAAPGVVAVSWTWAATASRDSVAWTYARAGEDVGLQWSRDGEGARAWIWTWAGARRLGYRVSAARTTGWCESYAWAGGAWSLRQEIAWDAGHGHRLRLDAAGQEISREAW
jgi:hypothetical protein